MNNIKYLLYKFFDNSSLLFKVLFFILAISLPVFISYVSTGEEGLPSYYKYVLIIAIVITTFLLFGYILNRFLINEARGSDKYSDDDYYDKNNNKDRVNFDIEQLKDDLNILKLRLKDKKDTINEKDILDTISNKVDSYLNTDIISKLEARFGSNYLSELKYTEILKDINSTQDRIYGYIVNLKANSRLNLIIGVLTTFVAAIGIVYSAFAMDKTGVGIEELFKYYIPRLSAVVFIEVFAFFFLKLYRGNLEDVKYFQNEKTNIDFKILTLKIALQNNDSNLINAIINELVKTERNFRLSKDETTVNIEREKMNISSDNELLKLLNKIYPGKS